MSQVVETAVATPAEDRQIFGQPRGIATLFLTEMWERFSFYGARAMLVPFMAATLAAGGLGISDKNANAAYGLYLAGSYLTGILGGWIADRLIGAQRAVVAGGVFIMVGNAMLTAGNPKINKVRRFTRLLLQLSASSGAAGRRRKGRTSMSRMLQPAGRQSPRAPEARSACWTSTSAACR